MNDQIDTSSRRRVSRKTLFALAICGIYIAIAACSYTIRQYTVMRPPALLGATFAGMQSCAECHEDMVRDFAGATHSKLLADTSNIEVGCEACHGPGSIHNTSGGEIGTIHNPKADPATCFQCHLDTRGSFSLPHAHPVGNGSVTCVSCHDSHHGSAIKGGGVALQTETDTCLQCHSAQAGPFVFEHEASREGCTTCHVPHGSVNEKMLKSRGSTLCLQCHNQQQTASGQIMIGGRDHASFTARLTCWSAGCHEAVHGSHINSSLRF